MEIIDKAVLYFHHIYCAPLLLVIIGYVMYDIVGISCFPGLLFVILEAFLIQGKFLVIYLEIALYRNITFFELKIRSVNSVLFALGYLSKIQGKLRSRVALLTGKRLAVMNDIISGIQVIKMYAWEKPFEAVVTTARK